MDPLKKKRQKVESPRAKLSESIIFIPQISVAKSKEIEVGGFGLINYLIATFGTCLIACIVWTACGK